MREYFLEGSCTKKKPIFISLLAFVTCIILSTSVYADSAESVVTDGHSHKDVKRGERFFKGLLPFEKDHASCVSCHNINQVDTLNWNPSAMEIALKYADKDFEAFQAVIVNPLGKKMSEVHANIKIEDEDLKTIKIYLDEFAHKGPAKEKANVVWLVGLLILVLLILASLIDLILTKKVKPQVIVVLVLVVSFGWLAKILYTEAVDLGRQQAYAPLQPIKFSHEVHAGLNQTDCLYCHSTAEYSKSAGIPSVSTCMNCHLLVREGTNSGKFEIDKIHYAFENNIPVEWVRIHNLPDHVFFSHAQHVGAGKLDCAECHGKVEEMDILTQHSELSMGWCLDCHKTQKVQFLENDYYTTFKEFHDQIKSGQIDSVTVAQVGGTDCMKCHY